MADAAMFKALGLAPRAYGGQEDEESLRQYMLRKMLMENNQAFAQQPVSSIPEGLIRALTSVGIGYMGSQAREESEEGKKNAARELAKMLAGDPPVSREALQEREGQLRGAAEANPQWAIEPPPDPEVLKAYQATKDAPPPGEMSAFGEGSPSIAFGSEPPAAPIPETPESAAAKQGVLPGPSSFGSTRLHEKGWLPIKPAQDALAAYDKRVDDLGAFFGGMTRKELQQFRTAALAKKFFPEKKEEKLYTVGNALVRSDGSVAYKGQDREERPIILPPGAVAVDKDGKVIAQGQNREERPIILPPGAVAVDKNGKVIAQGQDREERPIILSPGAVAVDKAGKVIAQGQAPKPPPQKYQTYGNPETGAMVNSLDGVHVYDPEDPNSKVPLPRGYIDVSTPGVWEAIQARVGDRGAIEVYNQRVAAQQRDRAAAASSAGSGLGTPPSGAPSQVGVGMQDSVLRGTGFWNGVLAKVGQVTGALGLGGFRATDEAQAAKNSLLLLRKEGTMAYENRSRESVWQDKQVYSLLPDPDTFWSDPQKELGKLDNLLNVLANKYTQSVQSLGFNPQPGTRDKINARLQEIEGIFKLANAPLPGGGFRPWLSQTEPQAVPGGPPAPQGAAPSATPSAAPRPRAELERDLAAEMAKPQRDPAAIQRLLDAIDQSGSR